jgi:hypothetical protein
VVQVHGLVLHFKAFSQFTRQKQPSLRIDFGITTERVREKPQIFGSLGVLATFAEHSFDFFPLRNRINSTYAPVEGGDEDFGLAESRKKLLEINWQLQPALFVYTPGVDTPGRLGGGEFGSIFHFRPRRSTSGHLNQDCHTPPR